MQQRATSWNQIWGRCREDTVPVHWVPAQPTEILGHPLDAFIQLLFTPIVKFLFLFNKAKKVGIT